MLCLEARTGRAREKHSCSVIFVHGAVSKILEPPSAKTNEPQSSNTASHVLADAGAEGS